MTPSIGIAARTTQTLENSSDGGVKPFQAWRKREKPRRKIRRVRRTWNPEEMKSDPSENKPPCQSPQQAIDLTTGGTAFGHRAEGHPGIDRDNQAHGGEALTDRLPDQS